MNLLEKPRRIAVIAGHTFTQLVRMKVFYFLAVFALIALASKLIELPQDIGPASSAMQALQSIRDLSFGTMSLFSVVLGITATALLLPRDVEDRTLYTILSKPVPRFDYLAGKLLGVLVLLLASLAMMDAMMCGVLHLRTVQVAAEQLEYARGQGASEAAQAALSHEVFAQGVTWQLHAAVLVVFLRAAVIAAFALMLSTFSSSTLFTIIVSFTVYCLGHFQADAREFYLHTGAGTTMAARLGAMLITLVVPDFTMFNVVDALVAGKTLAPMALVRLAGVTLFYALTYLAASRVVFAKKEF